MKAKQPKVRSAVRAGVISKRTAPEPLRGEKLDYLVIDEVDVQHNRNVR